MITSPKLDANGSKSCCFCVHLKTYTSVAHLSELLSRQGSLPVENISLEYLSLRFEHFSHSPAEMGGCANLRTRQVSAVQMTVTR